MTVFVREGSNAATEMDRMMVVVGRSLRESLGRRGDVHVVFDVKMLQIAPLPSPLSSKSTDLSPSANTAVTSDSRLQDDAYHVCWLVVVVVAGRISRLACDDAPKSDLRECASLTKLRTGLLAPKPIISSTSTCLSTVGSQL